MPAGKTKAAQIVIPEVLKPMVQFEFEKALKFTPLAVVDTTLVGQPGDTITMPKWGYIGDAVNVEELGEIPINQMTHTKTSMTISKAGNGVELSDEALTRGFGDPQGEAVRQLGMSIANKVDNDILEKAKAVTKFTAGSASTKVEEAIEAGIIAFNEEDFNTSTVLLVSPKGHAALRKSALFDGTNLKGELLQSGVVGKFLGVDVVLSRKLTDGEAFLIKQGAFKIVLKRDMLVETDRDIIRKSTVITADKHYGVYVADDSKIVKITHKPLG